MNKYLTETKNLQIIFWFNLLIIFFNYTNNNFVNFYFPILFLNVLTFILFIVIIFRKTKHLFHENSLIRSINSYCENLFRNNEFKINKKFYFTSLLILFSVFTIISASNIYTKDIGTDEGNVLQVISLLESNNIIYKDFWTREPMSAYLLYPYIKIFGNSITNLRFFVLVINLLNLTTIFLITKKHFNKFYQLLILIISIFQIYNLYNIHAGLFYHLWSLLLVIFIYIILNKKNQDHHLSHLIIISLLAGISILTYKAFQVFWIIFPFIFYLKNFPDFKKIAKKSIAFLMVSSVPIILFTIYNALRTNFFHIYKIIISDVTINFLRILVIFISFYVLIKIKFIKTKLRSIDAKNIIFLSNIFIVALLLFLYIKDKEIVTFSFWGGIGLEAFYFFFSLLTINFLYFKNKKRKILFFLYIAVLTFYAISGYGSRGFFKDVPGSTHLIFFLFILISLFYFVQLCFNEKKLKTKEQKKETFELLIIISNILFASFFITAYIAPSRIIMFLSLYPILLIFTLLFMSKSKNYLIYNFLFINLALLIFTNYNYLTIKNDYTLGYTINSIEEAKNYITKNTQASEYFFTGDTAISSYVDRENVLKLTSPWNYRERKDVFYNYPGLKENFPQDISFGKEELLEQLYTKRPKIIIGSPRLTISTFFDSTNDKNNTELESFFKENYQLAKKIDTILIYTLKNPI